jgi:pyruvate formate lyase activating enzyme
MYSCCEYTGIGCAAPEAHDPGPSTEGFIEAVETCGAVDGPGVRYVVFTRGCPLRCLYCHNPETQGPARGRRVPASEVLDDLLRYKPFLRRGGLTVSGGEPLMQPAFVHALFRGAREAGLHTALDTSGFLGERASDALLADCDLVLLDIKSGDPATHRQATGVGVERTLRFARRLSAMGKPVWIRFVLVPGLTDAEANIDALAAFVATLENVERVEILPFHKMGEHKYAERGLAYQLTDTPAASEEDVARAREIFARHGLTAL